MSQTNSGRLFSVWSNKKVKFKNVFDKSTFTMKLQADSKLFSGQKSSRSSAGGILGDQISSETPYGLQNIKAHKIRKKSCFSKKLSN